MTKSYPLVDWVNNPDNRQAVIDTVNVVKGDGWAIFDPAAFASMPDDVKAIYDRGHKSDKASVKTTITRQDGSMGDVSGIYGLDVLEGIAGVLGIRSSKMGRGSRALDLYNNIIEALRQH